MNIFLVQHQIKKTFIYTPLNRFDRIMLFSVLKDFSITVKVATSIFISGRGSAISSAKQGKSGSIYNLVKNYQIVWAAQTCVHFMKILMVYTLNSHLLTIKAHNHKMYVFCRLIKYLKPHKQTVWTQIILQEQ